jgi:hypothetical protein
MNLPPPNLRLNALRLGLRLMLAATNPFSGLNQSAACAGQWQPVHPFGLPRWWPFRPGSGRSFDVDQIGLMRSVLPVEDERQRNEQASLRLEQLSRDRLQANSREMP